MYHLLLQLRTLVRAGKKNKYSLVLKLRASKTLIQSKQPKPEMGEYTNYEHQLEKKQHIGVCSFPSSGLASGRFRFLNNPTPTDECSVV